MRKLPLTFTIGTVSAAAQNRQALANEIASKLLGYVEEAILRGQIGGTEPTSDQGIWVNGNRFYNWNATLSDYEVMGFDVTPRAAGLLIVNDGSAPNNKMVITAEAVPLRNAASNSVILLRDVSAISDISLGVAANGLATGLSETANTWYHYWLMSNGSATQTRLGDSYTVAPVVSGYQYSYYLGPVRNDGSSNFIRQQQDDRIVYVDNFLIFTTLSSSVLNTYQDVDTGGTNPLSAGIPPNARAVRVQFGTGTTAGQYTAIVLSSSSTGLFETFQYQNASGVSSASWAVSAPPFWQPIVTPQKLWWKQTYSIAYKQKLVVAGYAF